LYHSTLGSRAIKKKKRKLRVEGFRLQVVGLRVEGQGVGLRVEGWHGGAWPANARDSCPEA
jgi:hypothetical protein